MATNETVHARPCSGCPYRKDCPSGVWHRSEYEKLAEYDQETALQPIGVFLCHDGDRESTLCRGWLDCHDKSQLLALRIAVSMGRCDQKIFKLPASPVPVFESGTEAMKHGLKRMRRPGKNASELQSKLLKRHPGLKLE